MVIILNDNIIYLDLIILYDFFINFIFLFFIEKIYNEKIKIFHLLLVSFIGSILIIFAFYNAIYLKVMKIILGLLLIIFLCFSNEKSKIIIKISLFYTLNFGFVGLLTAFKITKWYYLFCGIIVIFILLFFENYRKYHIFIKSNEYNVIMKNKRYTVNIKGLLDTGNMSSYLGYPVVYLNKKFYFLIEDKNKVVLSIETVSGIKHIDGVIYKNFLFEVNKKKYYRDVVLVLSDINVDCLLNPMLLL